MGSPPSDMNLFHVNALYKDRFMKSLALSVWVASILALTGCNTVKGVGQDIQKAGSVIEGAAK